jgi:hypothetical protein
MKRSLSFANITSLAEDEPFQRDVRKVRSCNHVISLQKLGVFEFDVDEWEKVDECSHEPDQGEEGDKLASMFSVASFKESQAANPFPKKLVFSSNQIKKMVSGQISSLQPELVPVNT